MVILFSKRNSKKEKEIIEILTKYGGDYISDKKVYESKGKFTIISEYKKTDVRINKGIVIFVDDIKKLSGQIFPKGIIGICENGNTNALEIFERSKNPVISCGMNAKNTITLSSLNEENILLSLQRTLVLIDGTEAEPCELNIRLTQNYEPFSLMTCAAVLMMYGILPDEF